jgi:WD40 repeat protein
MDIEKFLLSIENSILVSGSRDNKVIFWDTKTGQILKTIMIGRNLVC